MEYFGHSKLFKAIALATASLIVFAGVAVVSPKVAKAETVEELQAQIQALLQQIAQLQSQMAVLESGETSTNGGNNLYCYNFTRNLTVGMSGDDVKALQEILISEGTWTRSDIGATGYFGPITKASLAAFQDKYADEILYPLGLTKGTGYFGPSTRDYISSRCVSTPSPQPTAEGPEIENAIPVDGASDVEKDTDISFEVTDSDGVDIDSLEVTVNDEDVTEDCATTEITDGYEVVCDVEEFESGEDVDVSVYVEDEKGNSTEESWSFSVKEEEVTGISVSLAGDTPDSANVPKNASNISFLKIKFSGKGTINSITITRVGAGSTDDFDYVYLYDGDTKLTTGRSLNSSTHQARFTSLNLDIDGEKVITVTADLSGSGNGDVNAFQITSADDISADVEISGNFPIRGNDIAITNVSAGGVTISKSGSVDNPKVGQEDAKLSEFKLEASSTEDIQIERIALYQGGSVSRSDITNLELKVGGEVVATAEGINDQDQAIFVFDTPYEIEKGNSRIFEVYGDIGAGVKPGESIKFYLDEATDLKAVGERYGYGVAVTNSFDSTDCHELTVQGGQVTISFNGPASTEIAAGGKDVTLMEITISSQNDIEIRKVSTTVIFTTGNASDNEYTDCKWVDADTGEVLTSSWDLSAGGTQSNTYTDIWTVDGGSSRNLKFTCDIASTADDGDQLKVSVNFAGSNYIKNLENNQWVSTSDIVPSSAITGNVMTVAKASLTLSTAGTPAAQTYVVGTTGAELVGISLRAGNASDIKVTSIKATFSVSGSFDASQDILRIALFDGDEQVSDWESVTNDSPDYVTFDNLSLTIPAGQTKVLVAKADIQASASAGTVSINVASSSVSAQDEEGNSITPSGSVSGPTMTITSGGQVTVERAPDDTETRAGLVVAGNEVTLAKFRFTAQYEDLELKKIKIGVVSSTSAVSDSSTADEVEVIRLYDGTTLLAEQPLDSATGLATFTGLSGFVVPKDSSKILTVKAQLNTISEGADSGTSLYAFLSTSGFEMLGQNTITSFSTSTGCVGNKGCYGNRKVVYKTVPTIEVADAEETLLSTGEEPLMKFTVTADEAEQVSIKRITLQISANNATVSLDTLGDIAIKDLTNGTWYRYSDGTLTHTTTSDIGNGESATTTITFTDAGGINIAAGSSVTFQVYINVAAIGSGSASVQGKLVLHSSEENAPATPDTYANLASENNYFIWSDNSAVPHSESSSDWLNGYKVEGLPSSAKTISKS